jgi:hypothetical protein
MNRYVITYFSDPAEQDVAELNTVFLEAFTEDDARDKAMSRFGTYIQIVSLALTKSCGGPGLPDETGGPVTVSKNVFYNKVQLEEVTTAFIDPTGKKVVDITAEKKKVKVVNRGGKVSNASLIRIKIGEAKAAGQDQTFVVDWAVATLGQTRPVAKSYVKNIWAE